MDLNKKTVLITGAARGLGGAIATGLATRGAQLALVDLDEASLQPMQAHSSTGAQNGSVGQCGKLAPAMTPAVQSSRRDSSRCSGNDRFMI